MHPQIARHRAEIAEICRRYRVRRLDIFGSAARGDDFDPAHSDIDSLPNSTSKTNPVPSPIISHYAMPSPP